MVDLLGFLKNAVPAGSEDSSFIKTFTHTAWEALSIDRRRDAFANSCVVIKHEDKTFLPTPFPRIRSFQDDPWLAGLDIHKLTYVTGMIAFCSKYHN